MSVSLSCSSSSVATKKVSCFVNLPYYSISDQVEDYWSKNGNVISIPLKLRVWSTGKMEEIIDLNTTHRK